MIREGICINGPLQRKLLGISEGAPRSILTPEQREYVFATVDVDGEIKHYWIWRWTLFLPLEEQNEKEKSKNDNQS